MKNKTIFLDPKRVLIEFPTGEKYIVGFKSTINYQFEQQNVHFLDYLASLFEQYFEGDCEVVFGKIYSQLIIKGFDSILSIQRDNIQNRIIMGDRIHELREKKGMDIVTLAQRSNIQPNTLKRIEAGKFSCDQDILEQIAQGLGMKLDFVELKTEN